ncbi:MAG: transposase family protein [Rhodomicrobiaceae bacterium]
MLAIAFAAMHCGAETCFDMAMFGRAKRDALSRMLKLGHGIPGHDTFSRGTVGYFVP